MRVDRLSKMTEYINSHGSVTMEELCETFNVSLNTVRRDINSLLETGTIKKVYGGVTSNKTRALRLYNDRASSNLLAKEKIGKAAAALIQDNDIVFVDSGTTACEMIPYISAKNVTIFTASLPVLERAIPKENLAIILLPGRFSSETNSINGADAAEYLKRFNIQKAFMSASGFLPEKGATHAALEESPIKDAALQQSDIAYLLIDASKFGVSTLINYASTDCFSAIITDSSLNSIYKSSCKKNQIKLIEV